MEGRRRHVWPVTVDALAFESDAGRSTDGVVLLNDVVQRCLVQNDASNLEKLFAILHTQWSLAAPDATSGTEGLPSSGVCHANVIAAAWQTDCDALVALFYLSFAGSSVAEQVLELHLSLFLVKWFQSTDSLLQVASSVPSDYLTESFVTMTLLYCCLQRQHPLPKIDVSLFLEMLENYSKDASSPMGSSNAPLWLQDVVGSNTPYKGVIASLTSWVLFANAITTDARGSCSFVANHGEFSSLLHIVVHYQHHRMIEEDPKVNTQPTASEGCSACPPQSTTIVQDHALRACLFWLNGLMAAHRNKLCLASAEYSTALETSVDCSAVLYNAYLAFSRRGVHNASLECLQLLLRSCQLPSREGGCVPFTSALLAPLLPKPCQHAVTALLAAVCLRLQKTKEASDLLSALLPDPSLRDVTFPAASYHPRLLLLSRDCPPSCPSRPVLLAQAVIAAARLQEMVLLNQLLEAAEVDNSAEAVRWRRFYSSDGSTQTEILSTILCALLRVSQKTREGRSSEAMTGSARLLDSTSWISPATNCPDGAPSLLVVTAVLCKTFLFSMLSHLHSDLDNDVCARHFQRLKKQALASVANIAGIEMKTNKTEREDKVKMNIRVADQLKQEQKLFDELDEPHSKCKNVLNEATGANSLCSVVNLYCDTVYYIPNLDETCLISVKNIATFLSEHVELN